MIKAWIFDLDGVIVNTAKYHFLAWRRLAAHVGYDLTEKDNEKLKGVSRMGSLEMILKWAGKKFSEAEKIELATRKNNWYLEYVNGMKPDEILEGVIPFLTDLKSNGYRIALGSSSKNSGTVLEKIGLFSLFDAVIDGTKTTRTKPDPQVFELGARAMGCVPEECVVFEDSIRGIEAALAGGFYAVGVGESENLNGAHMVIPGFKSLKYDQIKKQLEGRLVHADNG